MGLFSLPHHLNGAYERMVTVQLVDSSQTAKEGKRDRSNRPQTSSLLSQPLNYEAHIYQLVTTNLAVLKEIYIYISNQGA